jgi:hypothetical protein
MNCWCWNAGSRVYPVTFVAAAMVKAAEAAPERACGASVIKSVTISASNACRVRSNVGRGIGGDARYGYA